MSAEIIGTLDAVTQCPVCMGIDSLMQMEQAQFSQPCPDAMECVSEVVCDAGHELTVIAFKMSDEQVAEMAKLAEVCGEEPPKPGLTMICVRSRS